MLTPHLIGVGRWLSGVFRRVTIYYSQVSLFVILFPSEQENSVNETVSLMRSLQRHYPKHRLAVVPVFDSFARALALEIGAAQVNGSTLQKNKNTLLKNYNNCPLMECERSSQH